MKIVNNIQEVHNTLNKVKKRAPKAQTNFFLNIEKMERWISKGLLINLSSDKTLVLLRKHINFYYLYYYTESITDLIHILSSSAQAKDGLIVAELIGRTQEISELAKLFIDGGFLDYFLLNRMQRTTYTPPEVSQEDCQNISFAEETDVFVIHNMISDHFDIFAEQIPVPDEIKLAIQKQQILVYKEQGLIKGLIYFEILGFYSHLKYWVVLDMYKSKGIGKKLIMNYFGLSKYAKRMILWVGANNQKAIEIYEELGYQLDGVSTTVLIYKGE